MGNVKLELTTPIELLQKGEWMGLTDDIANTRKMLETTQGGKPCCASIEGVHLQRIMAGYDLSYMIYFIVPRLDDQLFGAMASLVDSYRDNYLNAMAAEHGGEWKDPLENCDVNGFYNTNDGLFGLYVPLDVTDEQLCEFIRRSFIVMRCLLLNVDMMLGNKQLNDQLASNRKLIENADGTYAVKRRKGVAGPIGRTKTKRKSRKNRR